MYTPPKNPCLRAWQSKKDKWAWYTSPTIIRFFSLASWDTATLAAPSVTTAICTPRKPGMSAISDPAKSTAKSMAALPRAIPNACIVAVSPMTDVMVIWPKNLPMPSHAWLKTVSGRIVRQKFGNWVRSLRSGLVAVPETMGMRAGYAILMALEVPPEHPGPRMPTGVEARFVMFQCTVKRSVSCVLIVPSWFTSRFASGTPGANSSYSLLRRFLSVISWPLTPLHRLSW